MAFFKFRKGGDDQTTTAPQPESIEAMRQRAKHRLIGAAVLVLVGVIGFPLLVDKQPRPIAVDIPIEIPDKNKVKPLTVAPLVQLAASAPVAPGPAVSVAAPAAMVEGRGGEVVAPGGMPASQSQLSKPVAAASSVSQPEAKLQAQAEPRPAEKTAEKPATDSGAKAQALLDGKEPPKTAAAEDRFVVQVGAFADVAKAREARLKLERTGFKTYTQVVEAKDGRRVRVRVGPFATKVEADKAAEKIKKLDLPAAILTL